MARSTFGGTLADYVVAISGGFFTLTDTNLTFWDSETGGTRQTDLLLNGQAVTSIPVTGSQIPQFQGPDGVTQMWVSGGAGDRVLMLAQGGGGGSGTPGAGVAPGGTSGQVLVKTGSGDYATGWADPTTGSVPTASTTVAGIVPLATSAQATTGTDTSHAVTPKGLADALAGLTVVAGVLVWRYASGAWPTLPTTKPTGVVLVEAIGPTQPPSVPSWIGTTPTTVPSTYVYAPLT